MMAKGTKEFGRALCRSEILAKLTAFSVIKKAESSILSKQASALAKELSLYSKIIAKSNNK